ncbi:uncharacterized protein LOC122576548 isoform X2 [Bombus pyrosoma]|uniref:uncharacterized protein LOC122576548 isoform X2 n=1 Tax=Bombus pyrosoma TaxID=396416 RepID=UPI001CB891FA|nr:uncharacterized protein LOC122576548 isoform X2 [Bombus pyrosoma]
MQRINRSEDNSEYVYIYMSLYRKQLGRTEIISKWSFYAESSTGESLLFSPPMREILEGLWQYVISREKVKENLLLLGF